MAIVTKSSVASQIVERSRPVSARTAPPVVFKLPLVPEEPEADFNRYSVLIHGEKKIGKTTLALQGGKVLLIQFDPAQRAYRRIETLCKTWLDFTVVLKALEVAAKAGKFPYDRVVIDGADIWANLNQIYICEKLAIDDPGDLEYGKGWSAVRKNFESAVNRFLALPCGRWFICHSSWQEVKKRDGTAEVKLLPSLGKRAEEILNGKVDLWCAYDYTGQKHILCIAGSESVGAGHRMDQNEIGSPHFRTPLGKPVREIDMGATAQEGFSNLMKAYNNKQGYTVIAREEENIDKVKHPKVVSRKK